MEVANRKNCSTIKSNCTGRLEYHCFINPWGNVTVEVCAPATPISTDLIKKKVENSKNTSKYEAAELYEDFLFCYHRLIGLLHCLIAFVGSSVPTHSMIHVLAALLLVITRSSGECVPEAAIKVGNIRILGSCETCDSIKDYPICEGQNISACLRVFPGLYFGVGCAPNICINDGCPEWNGENGEYKIHYRSRECSPSCPGHLSLTEWIKNCSLPSPSLGTNCSSGENGSDSNLAIVLPITFLVAGVVGAIIVLGLCKKEQIFHRDHNICRRFFKNETPQDLEKNDENEITEREDKPECEDLLKEAGGSTIQSQINHKI